MCRDVPARQKRTEPVPAEGSNVEIVILSEGLSLPLAAVKCSNAARITWMKFSPGCCFRCGRSHGFPAYVCEPFKGYFILSLEVLFRIACFAF